MLEFTLTYYSMMVYAKENICLQVISPHMTLTSKNYYTKNTELTRCLSSCLDFDINSTHDLRYNTVTPLNLVSHN